jgi:3-deoxy-D-manno-octulosonate 8-phosphate phosphatase KdsC-like HAD superfamily phosphatase
VSFMGAIESQGYFRATVSLRIGEPSAIVGPDAVDIPVFKGSLHLVAVCHCSLSVGHLSTTVTQEEGGNLLAIAC